MNGEGRRGGMDDPRDGARIGEGRATRAGGAPRPHAISAHCIHIIVFSGGGGRGGPKRAPPRTAVTFGSPAAARLLRSRARRSGARMCGARRRTRT